MSWPPYQCITPVVEHWLEREIAKWVHHEGSSQRPITSRSNAQTTELHLAPRMLVSPHYTANATSHITHDPYWSVCISFSSTPHTMVQGHIGRNRWKQVSRIMSLENIQIIKVAIRLSRYLAARQRCTPTIENDDAGLSMSTS